MRLRKLLSGVTAAIMAISSVAVASFTSASAKSADFEPYSVILGSANYNALDVAVIAQGNATDEMVGATQAKIYCDCIDEIKDGQPETLFNSFTHLYVDYQVGYASTGAKDFTCSAVQDAKTTEWDGVRAFTLDLNTTMEAGQGYNITGYTKSWTNHNTKDNYVFGILFVEFLDKDGNVLYTQKELGSEPEFGAPAKDQLPLRFINTSGSDLCDPIIFDGDNLYTLETDINITEGTGTGSSYDGYGSFGLYNSYANLVISPKTAITINSLDLKGTTKSGETKDISVPITDAWKNRPVFDYKNEFKCYPIDHWGSGDQLDSAIPEEVDTLTHIKMVFTISGSELGTYEPPKEVKGEAFNKITYDYTVTDPGTANYIRWDAMANEGANKYFGVTSISGAGDYTTEVTLGGEEKLASLGSYVDATDNQNDANVDNVTQSKDTEIKLNKITINDTYTFEATDLVLTNKKQYANGLANLWNDQGKALIVTYKNSKDEEVQFTNPDAYLRGSEGVNANGIKLVKGAPPEVEDPDPDKPDVPVEPGPGSGLKGPYEAFLMFKNDSAHVWVNMFSNSEGGTGIDASVTGNGTYTVAVDEKSLDPTWWDQTAKPVGCNVFNVDIKGLATDIGAGSKGVGTDLTAVDKMNLAKKAGLTISDVSILSDGEEVYKYNDADLLYGDIEGNGNIRIEIYNEYGESGDSNQSNYNAPSEVCDLAQGLLQPQEKVEVKFTLNYTKPAGSDKPNNSGGNNNNNNTGNNNNKGGSTVKPGTPSKGTTVAPKSNAKADAKKIVKNAKIKKLSAKAKGKKVTITWKKASKVTGYNIQVATKKNFKKKSIVAKKTLKKNAKKVTLKIKKLKKGKTYWVRVQAYKSYKANGKTKKETGSWKKFKFKA